MDNKHFNVRVLMKHDIAENWAKAANFVPKAGEIIVYDDYYSDGTNNVAGFKVGDGQTTVNNLQFVDKRLVDHIADSSVHYNLGYDENNHTLIFSIPEE